MWSRPWRRRGKTAASRSMAGNLRPCGGQVIHSLPAAGLRGHLRSAMNNLGHGIMWSAAGDGGNTLTGADGLYNDGAFRAKTSPKLDLVLRCLTNSSMPPFGRHGIGPTSAMRECTFYAVSVCLQFGTERGEEGTRLENLKQSGPGHETRTPF